MKKIILMLALLICANQAIIMASNVSDAERAFNAAQKELQQLNVKYTKEQQKHERLQTEYNEALAQIEKNQDKPNSLPYKNALKKSESLSAKIAQSSSELETLNSQKDSLLKVVEEKQRALLAAQQSEGDAKQAKEDEREAKKLAKEQEKIAKQLAKDSAKMAKEFEKAQKKRLPEQESSVAGQEDSHTLVSKSNSANVNRQNSSQPSSSSSSNDNSLPAWFWISLIVIGSIMGWRNFKRKHHCPECGKWFTMESEGDTRVWDHDSRGNITKRGARKRYRCSNCGHETRFIEWFRK